MTAEMVEGSGMDVMVRRERARMRGLCDSESWLLASARSAEGAGRDQGARANVLRGSKEWHAACLPVSIGRS